MARLTLVTALFDLSRREIRPRLGPAAYFERGKFTLGLDVDLVCFADPELAPSIRSERSAIAPRARTEVVAVDLEALPAFGSAGLIAAASAEHPIRNLGPAKDTPLYPAFQRAKFELLGGVAASNPFGSSHIGWIDFAIGHIAETTHCRADGVFRKLSARVRLCQLKPAPAHLADDPFDYYGYLRGHAAAGYLSGEAAAVEEVSALACAEMDAMLAVGRAVSDEQVLGMLLATRRELFEPYPGDYNHILANSVRLRGSAANLVMQLRVYRELQDWAAACDLGARILDGRLDGSFEASGTHLSALLDEYLIAAFRLGRHEAHAIDTIASAYAALVRADPGMREEFLRNEIHIRNNFAQAGATLDL